MKQRVTKIPSPPGLERAPNGAMQIGDDWPGLFIRGDSAFAVMIEVRRWEKFLEEQPCSDLYCSMQTLSSIADIIAKDVVVGGWK